MRVDGAHALAREIRFQFLTGSVALSSLGDLAGMAFGFVASIGNAALFDVPLDFNPMISIVSFAFAADVGIVFGCYTARRAPQLDPIDALRHEEVRRLGSIVIDEDHLVGALNAHPDLAIPELVLFALSGDRPRQSGPGIDPAQPNFALHDDPPTP